MGRLTEVVLWILVGIFGVTSVSAQESWADKMFATRRHDFGTVAKGAKTEFRFVVTNPYVEAVHIQRVSSSCSCTSVFVEKDTIPTHGSGAIVARFETLAKTGANAATLTVVFDKPYRREVQLQVNGFIRGDVTFSPQSVSFGVVPEGSGGTRTVEMLYAGSASGWQVVGVDSPRRDISARVVERTPLQSRGQVRVKLEVTLDPSASLGAFSERLTLITNDPQSTKSRVPLLVEGTVRGKIAISPAVLFFGTLRPGEKVTRSIVMSGQLPFCIIGLNADDQYSGLSFTLPNLAADDPRAVWVISVNFTVPDDAPPGRFRHAVTITTSDPDLSPTFETLAVIADPPAPPPSVNDDALIIDDALSDEVPGHTSSVAGSVFSS